MIKESFEAAKPIGDKVVNKFYEFLFKDYPATRSMFKGVEMENQKKALLNSLVFIVDNVESPEKLVPYLKKMGGRHVAYGTKEEHYGAVGGTLLKTFKHFLGDAWTNELNEEWAKAYGVIADLMIQGAREEAPDADFIRERAKNLAHQLIVEEMEKALGADVKEMARQHVRRVLVQILDEEARSLIPKKKAA